MQNNHQRPINISGEERKKILGAIRRRVLKSHINVAGVNYDVWEHEFEECKSDWLAGDVPHFETGVRLALKKLSSSHTAFYHGQQDRFPPQHTINATLKRIDIAAEPQWMFLDVFPDGFANLAGIKPGDLLLSVNGKSTVPPDMPSFETGRTHVLRISTTGERSAKDVEIRLPFRKGSKGRPPILEPKALTSTFVSPSTGILQIPYFSGSAGLSFAKQLRSAIEDLKAKGADRLVIDLRGNIGGSLGFAALASYMCPDQRPIGFSITPQTLRNGYDKSELPQVPMPDNRMSLALTLGTFLFRDKSVVLLTQGLGRQPFHGRMVVLVNEWTNSAGEMAASFASENRLATVIGTRTAGNVLGATNFAVGAGYWLRLPVFGWLTWAGTCLEGKGVMPDVLIDKIPFGMGSNLNADIQVLAAHYQTLSNC